MNFHTILLLVLTFVAAGGSFILGLLPIKAYPPIFFQRACLALSVNWLLLAWGVPSARPFCLLAAVLALSARWQFKKENLLPGKLWLSMVTAFGVVALVLILRALLT